MKGFDCYVALFTASYDGIAVDLLELGCMNISKDDELRRYKQVKPGRLKCNRQV
jgi:hypothetical protein